MNNQLVAFEKIGISDWSKRQWQKYLNPDSLGLAGGNFRESDTTQGIANWLYAAKAAR